jgi:hypothetical protein
MVAAVAAAAAAVARGVFADARGSAGVGCIRDESPLARAGGRETSASVELLLLLFFEKSSVAGRTLGWSSVFPRRRGRGIKRARVREGQQRACVAGKQGGWRGRRRERLALVVGAGAGGTRRKRTRQLV